MSAAVKAEEARGSSVVYANSAPVANHTARPEPGLAVDVLFMEVAQKREETGPRVAPQNFTGPLPPERHRNEPPAFKSEEHRAEYEWLCQEFGLLENYTRRQLAGLQQQRQDLEAFHAQVEARLVLREQDANHRQSLLAKQADALRDRETAVSIREAAVTAREAMSARAEADLKQKLQALAAEAAELEQRVAQARAEASTLEAATAEARQQWLDLQEAIRFRAEEESRWPQTREQLRQRLQALDEAEAAMQRRTAELECLEEEVHEELQQRERGLAARLAKLAEDAEALRQREDLCQKREAERLAWEAEAGEAEESLRELLAAYDRVACEVAEQEKWLAQLTAEGERLTARDADEETPHCAPSLSPQAPAGGPQGE